MISQHTIAIEDLLERQPTLAVTRQLLTEVFHAFGSPEVRQVRADGALRARHFHRQAEIRQWADGADVEITEETVG